LFVKVIGFDIVEVCSGNDARMATRKYLANGARYLPEE